MRLATGFLIAFFMALRAPIVAADGYRTGNPGPPYPPSCITVPLRDLDLGADNVVKFFSGRMWLEVTHKIQSEDPYANVGQARLDLYRVGCSEPNRSVIVAEFSLPPEWVDPRKSELVLPWLTGSTGFDPFPLTFKPEANSWGQPPSQFFYSKRSFGDYLGGWGDARVFAWRYVIDVHPQGSSNGWSGAAAYYNGQFGLELQRSGELPFLGILVPATADLFEPTGSLALNGRLSGNWVEEGSADQGFVISFSNAPPNAGTEAPENDDLQVFLSWFTYGTRGEPLWLTGAAGFSQGANEVPIALERVEGGTFLGGAAAERATVGSARLRAIECNRLELEYQLEGLGLGAGVMHLQRLFALEIDDYPCRDFDAQYDSIYPSQTD